MYSSSQGTASTTTLTSHSSSHGMYNVVHVHYKVIWPDIFKLFCPYLICEIDYFALFIVFFWNQLLTMGVRQLEWLGNSVKMMHCWKWTPRFQAHKERPWILTVVNLDVVSLERITNDCLVARRHWFSVFFQVVVEEAEDEDLKAHFPQVLIGLILYKWRNDC